MRGGEEFPRLLTRRRPEEIEGEGMRIYRALLSESETIDDGNFHALSNADLECLFTLYDTIWFGGELSRLLARRSPHPLRFRLARRLTKSAGITRRERRVVQAPEGTKRLIDAYEIAISADLLFYSFAPDCRAIRVDGTLCADRLMALQRIFEHELVHLIEMLIWDTSSCRGKRFRRIARDLFGHLDTTHQLVTSQEWAGKQFGVRVGDRVTFAHEGKRHVGTINRITKRATVLVEDPRGALYSDGKRYVKFYVPLERLERWP